jgi:hypothetical protein
VVIGKIVQMYHVLTEKPVDGINRAVADTDGGGAAPRLLLIKSHILGIRTVMGVKAPARYRRGKKTVFKPGVAELNRFKQVGVSAYIHFI